MKKLDLNEAADEFDMIGSETHLFYNTETGEFDFYSEFMDAEDADAEKFDDGCWIAAPSQWDIDEYNMMVRFTADVSDPRSYELLSVALEGKGAFRRFKDTLQRLGLTEKWYAFRHEEYVDIAREWCDENHIPYISEVLKIQPRQAEVKKDPLDMAIIPLPAKIINEAAEVLCDALNYSKSDAEGEIRRMIKGPRIALAAITDDSVVGIIGAIPQYGVTGWELHPLAVLKEYQRRGVGTALVEAIEQEVAERGGITLYLGSDDETGATSLYGEDLYDDTFGKLANIQNIGSHPFPFYEKLGYKIVGVFPDVNGVGKPDIWLAKRIGRPQKRGKK